MRKSFYGKVLSAIVCLNAVGNAQTIWTEADFPTPKGHTWINPGNYEYGGDVHIQNINPVNFASNMSWIFIMLGFVTRGVLLEVGIILFSASVLFQIVTLVDKRLYKTNLFKKLVICFCLLF